MLRIRSYTNAVYDRIAPCTIGYGRTRLSQLYSLMNSKYFYLFYFILFILGPPDELYQETVNIGIFLLILGHFESKVQRTVSIFLNLFNLVFFF